MFAITPASRSTRMKPSQSAIVPIRPSAMVTAWRAESKRALLTAGILPL